MTTAAPPSTNAPESGPDATEAPGWLHRAVRAILTRRELLLVILLVVVLVWMTTLSYGGYLTGPYDPDYLASALVDAVPLAMLALAELLVIVSGRGGIDLSIGAIVSLTGMVFGFAHGQWGWPLLAAIGFAIVVGGLLGAVNGVLVAYLGFPALITTLATYYAYKSLAIVINDQKPISTPSIQSLY
jgi:ribose/xylose/arabinose/galactoside ABC-type transport system permease subunit